MLHKFGKKIVQNKPITATHKNLLDIEEIRKCKDFPCNESEKV